MRCHTTYTPSGDEFTTDVASSQGGHGQHPSPADMLASCVASCMLSMIAYTGASKGFDTDGIFIKATCGEGLRGIGSLLIDIHVPHPLTSSQRSMMIGAVNTCPVGQSLHPDIEKKITWHWEE